MQIFLTKQRAIQKHRKMWNWIAKETKEKKKKVTKSDYFKHCYIPMLFRPKNECYLCNYVKQKCHICPLDWGGLGCVHKSGNFEFDGLFWKWFNSLDWEQAANMASQIASLPECDIK